MVLLVSLGHIADRAPRATTSNDLHNPASPIWTHHPRLRAIPSSEFVLDYYEIQSSYHEDIIPTDPLIWGANIQELQNVQCIAAYCRNGGGIEALLVKFTTESGIPTRVVGGKFGRHFHAEDMLSESQTNTTADRSWAPFQVDGRGGEKIVGVDVVHDKDIRSVRLCTNHNREVIWGEDFCEGRVWEAMELTDGETFVGLAVGFTYPHGSEGYDAGLDLMWGLALRMEV
ncbi:hypothetical protein C8J57DRAFT_1265277 [Mycena rebaudengoi]|nr:hypothetical protein C8J57DRAFT_1265277 [Mycena rebaudengoi]